MMEVECVALDGSMKRIPKDLLILRPAVYAIIVHDGKLLLLKMRRTGKFHLPGGGIDTGEPMTDALRRELREETGIEIRIGQLAHFEEFFFYSDMSGNAYHGLHFYYICEPVSLALLDDDRVDDAAAEKPRWIDIRGLHASDFQAHGDAILRICREIAT